MPRSEIRPGQTMSSDTRRALEVANPHIFGKKPNVLPTDPEVIRAKYDKLRQDIGMAT